VNILGINAFHADSAAALLRDGNLVAAAEEERFRRIKHWAGFPAQAIAYCLTEAGLRLRDVDHVAVNQDNRAAWPRRVRHVLRHPPRPRLVLARAAERARRQRVPDLLAQAFPRDEFRGSFHRVEHHVAHLMSAFHVSPFGDAAVASIDGFGDFTSTAWGFGQDDDIAIDGRVYFPHSLGLFYQALTQYLGFPNYGDEYKVMGLAAYGRPTRLAAMRDIVGVIPGGGFKLDLRYFRHHRERIGDGDASGMPRFVDLFSPGMEALLGPRRRPDEAIDERTRDIASSVQAMYEEAFFHLLTGLHRRRPVTNIALAGGCALNSVANGKIRRATRFRHVYVQPAAGDAGGAIGAALGVWRKLGGRRRFVMDHAYWGPRFDDAGIAGVLARRRPEIAAAGCSVEQAAGEAELCRAAAEAVAGGRVVGWFQDRMEWGPRALGNRSILADPRRADMKEILNAKIKRREPFRPFAPAVLAEAVSEWFEQDDAVPFMSQVFQIRPERRDTIPAVAHVDGTARLQTVDCGANPRFYRLIASFAEMTGVPIVLNTSFNENEPVVCQPEEALDCFLRTRMDMLVMENTILSRGRPR